MKEAHVHWKRKRVLLFSTEISIKQEQLVQKDKERCLHRQFIVLNEFDKLLRSLGYKSAFFPDDAEV